QQGVVLIVIDEADLDQNGGHFGAAQDDEVWPGVDAQIFVADFLQLTVDVGGYGACRKPFIVNQALHSAVLIGVGAGIAMDGDEDISAGSIGLRGLLIGRFVDILCTGINDVETVAFQNF